VSTAGVGAEQSSVVDDHVVESPALAPVAVQPVAWTEVTFPGDAARSTAHTRAPPQAV
jgi:hypothetical protein